MAANKKTKKPPSKRTGSTEIVDPESNGEPKISPEVTDSSPQVRWEFEAPVEVCDAPRSSPAAEDPPPPPPSSSPAAEAEPTLMIDWLLSDELDPLKQAGPTLEMELDALRSYTAALREFETYRTEELRSVIQQCSAAIPHHVSARAVLKKVAERLQRIVDTIFEVS